MNVKNICVRTFLLVSLCAITALPSPARAIVIGMTDTSDFSNPASDWYGMTLDGIGMVGGGSAVAVGNHWFMSVCHFPIGVGSQIAMANNDIYTVTEVHNAPALLGQTSPVDLRIVKVAEELPDWYGMYDGALITGEPVIMAGTGFSGTTSPSGTFAYSTGTGRTWRWGTNEIDGPAWISSGVYRSSCIEMQFGYNDTDYEAGLGNGDSGGGTFLFDGGQWKLTGMNAYIDLLGPPVPPPYDVSYAVSVPAYIEWIRTIIPTGNINGDSVIDADDIDLLYDYIDSLGGSGSAPPADPLRDLDSDGTVDSGDVDFLVTTILGTQFGDFNLDGLIDTTDLTILATNFGLSDPGWAGGDANGDGVVDTTDLTIMASNFGFVAGAAAVPEPASIALVGAAMLVLRRRRRG